MTAGPLTAVFGIVSVIVAPFALIFFFLLIYQSIKMHDVKSMWAFICLYYYASWDQVKDAIGQKVTDEELIKWIHTRGFHYRDKDFRYRQSVRGCGMAVGSKEHSQTARIDSLGNIDGWTIGAAPEIDPVTKSYSEQIDYS